MSQSKVERQMPHAQSDPAARQAGTKREAKASNAVRRELSDGELEGVAGGSSEDNRSKL